MRPSENSHRSGLTSPESRAPLRPLRFALLVTGLYALLSSLWIVFSTEFASRLAGSVVNLRDIEQGKGILFVVTTSTMFFVALVVLARQVRQRELQILRQDEALMQAERSALAGIFAASVAHDVNNALTVALAALDQVGDDAAEHVRDSLESIHELNARLAQMGNERQGLGAPFDLTGALGREISLARRHEFVRGCDLRYEDGAPLWIRGVRGLVGRALLNLILNSAEATGGHGRIEVTVERDPGGVTVAVDDDGPGIPEDQRDRIFQPFFTTKSDGNGLGLMSVLACAQRHQGTARYRESALGGARFEIRFPGVRTLDSREAFHDTEDVDDA